MSERAVHFDAIEIHRALGIRHGEGFTLSELSPHVNLIHGPNGSGKTTTARVIQELLWPGRTDMNRPTVAGRYRDGDADWRIDIDAGHAETVCDGRAGTAAELGPPDLRHRYRLALHELIDDANAEFAKLIADASQGGYDLDAASEGFKERPALARKAGQQLRETREAVKAARDRQRQIEQAASTLADLRGRAAEAGEAHRRVQWLEKAVEHHDAEQRYQQIKVRLDALPDGVARLKGDEREQLDQLDAQRQKLERERADEWDRIERAAQELERLNLPEQGLAIDAIARLRADQRRLDAADSELRQHRQQHAEAEAEARTAQDRLAEHLSDTQLAVLETVEIGQLSAFARRAGQVLARGQVVEERRRGLLRDEPEADLATDAEQLRDGIAALGHWLASPPPVPASARLWWPMVAAAAVIAGLGVVMAILEHWTLLVVLAAVAVGLFVWDRWLRRGSPQSADARAVHRRSYETTALPSPPVWEVLAVTEHLRRLIQMTSVRARQDERLRRLGDLAAEAAELERQREDLDRQRRELHEQLGLDIRLGDEWLGLLVDNIALWQRCRTAGAGARQAVEGLEQERRQVLAQINASMGPYGYEPVDSAEGAAHLIEDLAQRQSRHCNAVSDRADAQRRIQSAVDPALDEIADRRREILRRLELEESDEREIDEWLNERPTYLDLAHQLTEAQAIRDDRRAALAERDDLLGLNLDEIRRRIDRELALADSRDQLNREIAGVEHQIDAAKVGHELSEALNAQDAAEAALVDVREAAGAAAAGAALVKWVRTVAVERSRPEVFRRANKLLVRFTGGALHLELDDHTANPSFRARNGTAPPRPLEELSVGERVQLLMAVRIAFLEQDEKAKLPLLLDEALGTCDDGRAGIIIDTVIEIAKGGRQVFYFTAQHDEVGKWVARLNASGIPHQVIDLAQVRRLSAVAAAPLQIAAVDVPKPPAPDGMNHERYGEMLGVPGVDPTFESIDGVHLWHLVEDVDLLHQLLCRGVRSWEQLHTLLQHGGAGLFTVDDGQFESTAATAKVIDAACRAWRIGRGKPVDRAALQDSGCVSVNFIDALCDMAKKTGGDARQIIQAMENGDVARWRSNKTETLREFFIDRGYLAQEDTLDRDAIRLHSMAAVAEDLKSGRIAISAIDRVMASLPL